MQMPPTSNTQVESAIAVAWRKIESFGRLRLMGLVWAGVGGVLTLWAVLDLLTGAASLVEFGYRTTYSLLMFLAPGWGVLAVMGIIAGLFARLPDGQPRQRLTPAALLLGVTNTVVTVMGVLTVMR